ncbi:MAG: hypothetical protein NC082_06940 [Clostridiales bacterium]|nr:hypothetical protein [Clostridiales bacterium]
MKIKSILSLLLFSLVAGVANAQLDKMNERSMWWSACKVDNASYGEYSNHTGKVLVTWRMLPGDDESTAFDIYRKYKGKAEVKLNSEPITVTNFQDSGLTLSGRCPDLTYRLTYAGSSETIASLEIKAKDINAAKPYITISLKETSTVCSLDTISYQANDVSVGDLDGDGIMEIVVKRLLSHGSSDGTGAGASPLNVRHTVLYEAYRLDGTFMWRVCSGPNIILGNSSSFAIADFDGDGKAEMGIKTGEGTIFGDGAEIGDTDGDGVTDYRTAGANYIGRGPEFFSIVDGETGRELARDNFITRGKSEDWGDNYFKRAHSLRVGVACVDGKLPSLILGRGVYARSVIEAWDYRDGKLTRRWNFDTARNEKGKDGRSYSQYAAQGFHSLSTGDVDGDGFDEIVYGSMVVDHDGVGLYTTRLGHGDALHLGKFIPSREGLQIYSCFETGRTEVALRDAATGEILYSHVGATDNDMGRACIADINPATPGCEMWWYGSHVFDIDGNDVGDKPSSCNMAIWFDGGLNRQVFSGVKIDNYKKGRVFTVYRFDVADINGTKENPSFYGDILGDWREEIIYPDATKTKDLKIFTSWYPSEHRFPWLMTDHVYLMSALNQNIGYNQPTHTGYYLGSDLGSDSEAWEAGGYTAGVDDVIFDKTPEYNDDTIYDLMGRKVVNPRAGIYIQHGKKIYIK